MNKEEMICKNCKHNYIEELSFDYPQNCCNKRKAVIEEWFNCNDFEYSNSYINKLQQENEILKENAENNDKVVDKINWENQLLKKENKQLKEVINKAIKCINKYEDIKAYYEYIDEDEYNEYNYNEDFKKELIHILQGDNNQ